MPGIYLEPAGLLYGEVAREAISLGGALPLAGSLSIAFAAVRLWEGEPGNIKYAIVRLSTIQAIDEPRVKELLDRLAAPRPAIAGVSMDGPRIMGIVNVTPDSFSDGGDHLEGEAAIGHAQKLVAGGADFIDIGAESTRPGSSPVAVEEELQRLLPVLKGLTGLSAPISADTRKPQVMREAAAAGARVLNDVSALGFAPDSLSTAAELKLPTVLMHAQGSPETMQDNPVYKDAVIEVYDFLESRIAAATAAGLPLRCIVADPGIGFGKTLAHNVSILHNVSIFHGLGVPLMAGVSRKGFIQKLSGAGGPKESTPGSVAAALDAISQGVQIVRVHDVHETRQALSLWKAIRGGLNVATQKS
ncbi:MAG: dihydropteroate synthase [Rhodomicrobium sp.]